MAQSPVAVDLNIDAALLLRQLAGIDGYPSQLMVSTTVFDPDDQIRVDNVVRGQLSRAGILVGDKVQPRVAHWLRCLDRPDVELSGDVFDERGDAEDERYTLRICLVRHGDTHVLALRNDDHLVVQEIFTGGRPAQALAAILGGVLGRRRPRRLEPWSAPAEVFDTLPADSVDSAHRALLKAGAPHGIAGSVARVKHEATLWAGFLMHEYHDGGRTTTPGWAGVFDTQKGRVVTVPSRGLDDRIWTTLLPGDDTALDRAVTSLVSLLPGGSWTDPTRTN